MALRLCRLRKPAEVLRSTSRPRGGTPSRRRWLWGASRPLLLRAAAGGAVGTAVDPAEARFLEGMELLSVAYSPATEQADGEQKDGTIVKYF